MFEQLIQTASLAGDATSTLLAMVGLISASWMGRGVYLNWREQVEIDKILTRKDG